MTCSSDAHAWEWVGINKTYMEQHMTREEAEKLSAELVAKGMAEADAYEAAALTMLAALKHLEASLADWNDAKVFDKARAAIAQAEAAGIKER